MEDPEIIYLQREEDETFGRTWCEDKIYDDDVKYIRADIVNPLSTRIKNKEASSLNNG